MRDTSTLGDRYSRHDADRSVCFTGMNALKTELQFSDMYCLMAAHVYIDLWRDTGECLRLSFQSGFGLHGSVPDAFFPCVAGDESMVWQGLGVLQEGLSHSPSNAQFKLLLLLLYCHLGAFEPVVDLYSSLDAKHVQHDTIGSVHYVWNLAL